MARLVLLTAAELTRDPRARRAAAAARGLGLDVAGVSGRISGEEPEPLEGVEVVRVGRRGRSDVRWAAGTHGLREPPLLRELRGLYRLGRLGVRTLQLVRGGRTLGDVRVVHANDLETLPAGWLLARGRRTRLVYDAHELYSEFEPERPRLYGAVADALEGALARRADAIVTVSDELARELRRRLGLAAMPAVVMNVPELDPREPEEPGGGPLRAIYQGAFGPGRPLDDLLDAVAAAPGVRLTIRAARAEPGPLRAAVARRGLADRVAVEHGVPVAGVLDGLRGHDVGIVFDRPLTRNSELTLPNKLFEYLMAGLAVVAPALPGLRGVLEETGAGVTYDPGKPELLGARLEELAADRVALDQLRRSARRAAVERFNSGASARALASAWGLADRDTPADA
jgi:glycosyltransferase involved in cell wall biosynthesis